MAETIGAVVNEHFRKSGLTNHEFATFLNVSLPQLYLITDDVSNPSLLVLVELAERLDISLWELLGVESPRKAASGAKRARRPQKLRELRGFHLNEEREERAQRDHFLVFRYLRTATK